MDQVMEFVMHANIHVFNARLVLKFAQSVTSLKVICSFMDQTVLIPAQLALSQMWRI